MPESEPVVEVKGTSAYKICKKYYLCYIPQHHLYSEDFIKHVGIPTSGDRAVDRQLAKNAVASQLTIADMAEHFSQGANITLNNPKDSVEIYQIIQMHLREWGDIINDPLDSSDPPTEYLQKLDQFAGEVYTIAKHYMPQEHYGNKFFKGLSDLESRHTVSRQNDEEKKKPLFKVPDEHVSLGNILSQHSFEKHRRWYRG